MRCLQSTAISLREMAEQTEAGRQRRGGNLSLSAASRSADVPCPGLGCRKEEILLSQAAGRIAGDFVNLYPPGIPVLVPGEQIEETHCRQLAEYLKEDLNVQGVTKDAGYRITVVKTNNFNSRKDLA